MFRTYDPLTIIQIPAKPNAEGTSCRRSHEVPLSITGVNASIGMASERSEEDNALKISRRPRILSTVVTVTAK